MQPGSNQSPPQIPCYLAGNLAGNFLKKGPPTAILASKTQAGSIAYKQIPCSKEQGIFLTEQGILARGAGNFGILVSVHCSHTIFPPAKRDLFSLAFLQKRGGTDGGRRALS
jgi:hypothetical protein